MLDDGFGEYEQSVNHPKELEVNDKDDLLKEISLLRNALKISTETQQKNEIIYKQRVEHLEKKNKHLEEKVDFIEKQAEKLKQILKTNEITEKHIYF